jgi:PAS domain S-box-containing protein
MPAELHDPPVLTRAEHAVARALAETARSDEVYPRVLAAIGEALGWGLGAVWEAPAEPGGTMCCVATWHAAGVEAGEFEALSRATGFGPGQGLPGRVWSSGSPAWIAEVAEDPNFPRADAARRAGLHAAVCFPMSGPAGVLGAIEFFSGEHREPDALVTATMASIGAQVGQFVQRRRAEQAVLEAAELKRAMLDASLDCIVTMNHEGCVLDFNPAAERTFGYRAGDVIGREMAELIVPPSLRAMHRAGLARYLEGGDARVLDRRLEITGMRADGSEFPVELTITRIEVPGPPTFTGYIRDITDRKAAERELRESRARLVAAADEERRRIERDLHDGAQQRLVASALGLRLARAKMSADPAAALEALDQAEAELDGAATELRELARGIHPAILTDGGLEPALAMLARRSPVVAHVSVDLGGRLPPAVESAAYFVVSEALTNVARYAGAARVEVRAEMRDGSLALRVSDDGCGGADPAGGSGLRGLTDRLAALDGTLTVDSPPGGGTALRAEVPCG